MRITGGLCRGPARLPINDYAVNSHNGPYGAQPIYPIITVAGLTRRLGNTGGPMFKLRMFRIAIALSSFAALAASVGADHKWG